MTVGPVTVTATCSGGCTGPQQFVTFNATVTPASNIISISSGNNQSSPAGETVPNPLTVAFSGTGTGVVDWQITGVSDAIFLQSGTEQYSQSFTSTPGSTLSVNLAYGATTGPITATATCSAGCTGPTAVGDVPRGNHGGTAGLGNGCRQR